jgi:hypothetical protein
VLGGAESKDLGGAYLSMLLGAFRPPSPTAGSAAIRT